MRTGFRSMTCSSSVHDNRSLTDSQRLQYFKASLQGDAAKLLTSLAITDANYSIALQTLEERYANPRMIARTHLTSIFEYPNVKSESSKDLRKLIETTEQHRLGLENLGQPVNQFDLVFVYIVSNKLDSETRKQWELSTTSTDFQTYQQLKTFVESRCQALEAPVVNVTKHKDFEVKVNQRDPRSFTQSYATHWKKDSCLACDANDHKLYGYPKFEQMSRQEKASFIERNNLCFNCLRVGHRLDACPSQSSCRECQKSHHTSLHPQLRLNPSRGNEVNCHSDTAAMHSIVTDTQTVLPTALIPVRGKLGITHLRALLDSGSQASFITETAHQLLQFPKQSLNLLVNGIGGNSTSLSRAFSDFMILPKQFDPSNVNGFILPKLTQKLPSRKVQNFNWSKLKNMQLADPYFSEPAPVDLILGADVLEELLLSSKIKLGTGLPLTETKLGWVVTGAVQAKHSISIQSLHTLDSQLQNFWRLEEVPDIGNHTEEEMECEKFFDQTTYRDETGRFVVKLPFKQPIGVLGNPFQSALRRFYALERKLNINPDLKQRHSASIIEFLSLGHMEVIPDKKTAISNSDSYYLPHHCVFKEESSTTKLRVVFDASAKTSSGVSLNKRSGRSYKVTFSILF